MNIKTILSFAMGPIAAAALGLLCVPLIAWIFNPEDVGKMSLVVVFASFCNLVFNLGLDQAYVREYYESNNKQSLLIMTFIPGLLILIFVLFFLSFYSASIIQTVFDLNSDTIFFVISIYFLTVYVSRYVTLILRMQGRAMAYSFSQFVPKALLILLLLSFLFFSFSVEFLYLVTAHLLALLLTTIFFIWYTWEEWKLALTSSIDKIKLKSMLVFGLPLIFASLSFWGMTSIDRVFLRYYSGFDELGIYSVAVNFAGVAIILQSVFSTIWSPMVYRWIAEGVELNRVFAITNWMVAIIGVLFSLAGLFSWVIPYLLPPSFSEVQYIFVACLGYPLFYTLSETTVVGINVTKKTKYSMLAGVIALCINVFANYMFVPLYGAKGAAISTALSFWVFFVCRTEFSSRVWIKMKKREKIYIKTLTYMLCVILFVLFGEEHFIIFTGIFLILLTTCSMRIFKMYKKMNVN